MRLFSMAIKYKTRIVQYCLRFCLFQVKIDLVKYKYKIYIHRTVLKLKQKKNAQQRNRKIDNYLIVKETKEQFQLLRNDKVQPYKGR